MQTPPKPPVLDGPTEVDLAQRAITRLLPAELAAALMPSVYLRTIAELRKQGLLWLLFAPLATDATPDALRAVVRAPKKTAV